MKWYFYTRYYNKKCTFQTITLQRNELLLRRKYNNIYNILFQTRLLQYMMQRLTLFGYKDKK